MIPFCIQTDARCSAADYFPHADRNLLSTRPIEVPGVIAENYISVKTETETTP